MARHTSASKLFRGTKVKSNFRKSVEVKDFMLLLYYFLPGQNNISKPVRPQYYPWAQTTAKPTGPRSCHDHHVQTINYVFCFSLFQNNKPASILVNTFLKFFQNHNISFPTFLVELICFDFVACLCLLICCVVPLQALLVAKIFHTLR